MKTLYSDNRKKADPAKVRRVIFLLIIFAAAFILRVFWIQVHPAVFHPARQYQSSLISRAFFLNTDDNKHDIGRLPALMFHNSREKIDPRISEMLTYQMYRMAGEENLVIPRLMSVLYWIIGGIIIYKTAVLLFGFTGGFITLIFYLFFPFGINMSQSVQPESLLNLLFLWAVHQIVKHFQSEKGECFYSAAILSGFAVMVKITVIFPLLGLLVFSGMCKYGLKNYLVNWRTAWFYAIFLSIGTYFYVYNIFWNKTMQASAGALISPGLLFTSFFWSGWLTQIAAVIGIVPFLLSALLFFTIRKKEVKYTMAGLFLGYAVYALIFSYAAAAHDYFHLVLFSAAALMLGQTGVILENAEKRKPALKTLAFSILAAGAVFSVYHWNRFMWTDHTLDRYSPAYFLAGEQGSYFTGDIPEESIAKTAERIGELTDYGINNVFLSRSYGNTVMYYGKMFGIAWPTRDDFNFRKLKGRENLPAPELFRTKYAPLNPKYFIVTDLDEWARQEDLREFLDGRYEIFAREDRFIIYDLRKKKQTNSP